MSQLRWLSSLLTNAISVHQSTCRYVALFWQLMSPYESINQSNNITHTLFAGSPWFVEVTDPKSISVSGGGLDFILVNRKANFVVNCGENMSKNINVSITGNHRCSSKIVNPVHTYSLILSHPVSVEAVLNCLFCNNYINCFVYFHHHLYHTYKYTQIHCCGNLNTVLNIC